MGAASSHPSTMTYALIQAPGFQAHRKITKLVNILHYYWQDAFEFSIAKKTLAIFATPDTGFLAR